MKKTNTKTDHTAEGRQLATNLNTPPELLRKLSISSDFLTRKHVAENPNTPTNVLLKLRDEFPNQVLSNPLLPLLFLENPYIIDQLFQPHTLWSIVLDAQTPKEILGMLIHTKHTQIAEAARLHVNWAGEMNDGWDEAALEAITTKSFDEKKRGYSEGMLQSNAFPDFVIEQLPVAIRRAVAKQINTSTEVLEQLALDEDGIVRDNVANNPTTPEKVLKQLAVDEQPSVHEVTGKRFKCFGMQTSIHSIKHEFWQAFAIRHRLAQSQDSCETVLEQLAEDKNEDIRYLVARTPGIPVKLLEQLAQDENELVRLAVARNPSTAENKNILERLLEDKAPRVCQAARHCAITWYVAHKPQALPERFLPFVLECYAKNSDSPLIRLCALLHPKTPAEILAENCRSTQWRERYAIAQHPNTPLDTLHTLAGDGNRIVRAAAKANLQSRNTQP